jgi:hypothetical protein
MDYSPRRMDEYDRFGYYFLPRRYRWKFPYAVRFDMLEDTTYLTVSVEFQKTFREFVRSEYFDETEKVVEKLGKEIRGSMGS